MLSVPLTDALVMSSDLAASGGHVDVSGMCLLDSLTFLLVWQSARVKQLEVGEDLLWLRVSGEGKWQEWLSSCH